MKSIASTIGFLFFLGFLPTFSVGGMAFAEVSVVSSQPDGLTLSYRAVSVTSDTVSTEGKTYLRFSCEDHSLRGMTGGPALPVRTVLFATPRGSRPYWISPSIPVGP